MKNTAALKAYTCLAVSFPCIVLKEF
jgi:hypothetical protein